MQNAHLILTNLTFVLDVVSLVIERILMVATYKRQTIYLTKNGILFPYVGAVIKLKVLSILEMSR